MMGSENYDKQHNLFLQSIEKSGLEIDPYRTPHIISNSSVFSKLLF